MVLVSSRKKSIGFGKFGLGKKVLISVLENLESEKKVSVSVSVKILVLSFSGHNLLQTQGFNLKCNNHGHKLTMKVF